MKEYVLKPDPSIELFVKNILVFQNDDASSGNTLSFYADGFPGLLFHQSEGGLVALPHRKAMSPLSLYGQTIKPVELQAKGRYVIIVFQVYPFVPKSFWDLVPESLHDDCYNLLEPGNLDKNTRLPQQIDEIRSTETIEEKINRLTEIVSHFYETRKINFDEQVRKTIINILDSKGLFRITSFAEQENYSLRSIQRKFKKETGLSPKQFAKIVQFHASYQQLARNEFDKLTDVVYENGYTDQSHFIKVFKSFTGQTPKPFAL